jgi:tetratricopeptide (TPR) repeat protein
MDPEQVIANYSYRFDPETLREVLDEADTALFHRVRARLAAKLETAGDDASRARWLSLRAAVGRCLMDLDQALSDGLRGLAHAEAAADLPDRSRATVHQHAGKNLFDQGRYAEAREHFERALEVRRDGDPDLLASTEVALDGVRRQLAR